MRMGSASCAALSREFVLDQLALVPAEHTAILRVPQVGRARLLRDIRIAQRRYEAGHSGHAVPSGPWQAACTASEMPADRRRVATPHSGSPTIVLKHPS